MQIKEKLELLLHYRIENTQKLHKLNSSLKRSRENLVGWELDEKVAFNSKIDVRDPRYSNAEKRKVELAKHLAEDGELQTVRTKISDMEYELAETEAHEKILKLKERYLFKEIELALSENQFLTDYREICDTIDKATNGEDKPACWQCGEEVIPSGDNLSQRSFCSDKCCEKYNHEQAQMDHDSEYLEESL